MSLFKQGKEAEAGELFTAAEAKRRPWPAAGRPAGSQGRYSALLKK
jgi:hypothetical protein